MSYSFSGMTVPGSTKTEAQNSSSSTPDSRMTRNAAEVDSDRKKFTGLYTGPYFGTQMQSNISAQLGDSALLVCNVNQIGAKTVCLGSGCVAQLVERLLPTPEVRGSNPIIGKNLFVLNICLR